MGGDETRQITGKRHHATHDIRITNIAETEIGSRSDILTDQHHNESQEKLRNVANTKKRRHGEPEGSDKSQGQKKRHQKGLWNEQRNSSSILPPKDGESGHNILSVTPNSKSVRHTPKVFTVPRSSLIHPASDVSSGHSSVSSTDETSLPPMVTPLGLPAVGSTKSQIDPQHDALGSLDQVCSTCQGVFRGDAKNFLKGSSQCTLYREMYTFETYRHCDHCWEPVSTRSPQNLEQHQQTKSCMKAQWRAKGARLARTQAEKLVDRHYLEDEVLVEVLGKPSSTQDLVSPTLNQELESQGTQVIHTKTVQTSKLLPFGLPTPDSSDADRTDNPRQPQVKKCTMLVSKIEASEETSPHTHATDQRIASESSPTGILSAGTYCSASLSVEHVEPASSQSRVACPLSISDEVNKKSLVSEQVVGRLHRLQCMIIVKLEKVMYHHESGDRSGTANGVRKLVRLVRRLARRLRKRLKRFIHDDRAVLHLSLLVAWLNSVVLPQLENIGGLSQGFRLRLPSFSDPGQLSFRVNTASNEALSRELSEHGTSPESVTALPLQLSSQACRPASETYKYVLPRSATCPPTLAPENPPEPSKNLETNTSKTTRIRLRSSSPTIMTAQKLKAPPLAGLIAPVDGRFKITRVTSPIRKMEPRFGEVRHGSNSSSPYRIHKPIFEPRHRNAEPDAAARGSASDLRSVSGPNLLLRMSMATNGEENQMSPGRSRMKTPSVHRTLSVPARICLCDLTMCIHIVFYRTFAGKGVFRFSGVGTRKADKARGESLSSRDRPLDYTFEKPLHKILQCHDEDGCQVLEDVLSNFERSAGPCRRSDNTTSQQPVFIQYTIPAEPLFTYTVEIYGHDTHSTPTPYLKSPTDIRGAAPPPWISTPQDWHDLQHRVFRSKIALPEHQVQRQSYATALGLADEDIWRDFERSAERAAVGKIEEMLGTMWGRNEPAEREGLVRQVKVDVEADAEVEGDGMEFEYVRMTSEERRAMAEDEDWEVL